MGRQRVPKGKVFQKPDEKIINTLTALDVNHSDNELIEKFSELYPDDWEKIVKRYNDHERLTPKGKTHPMPPPRKYLLNICHRYRELHNKGKDLNLMLDELNKPKQKLSEETRDT